MQWSTTCFICCSEVLYALLLLLSCFSGVCKAFAFVSSIAMFASQSRFVSQLVLLVSCCPFLAVLALAASERAHVMRFLQREGSRENSRGDKLS